jgi:hypothetical protein
MVFEATSLIYLIACVIGYSQYFVARRRKMMLIKVVACMFSLTYFWILGAESAALAVGIAMTGSAMQGAFPDEMLAKTRMLRTVFAVGLAVAGMIVMADDLSQIWPLLAVAGARLVEVQSCTQRIRLGLLFSQMCWIFYAVDQGMVLLFFAENLAIMLNLSSIWMFEQKRKRQAVMAVAA